MARACLSRTVGGDGSRFDALLWLKAAGPEIFGGAEFDYRDKKTIDGKFTV
jgi:hypothetical protein